LETVAIPKPRAAASVVAPAAPPAPLKVASLDDPSLYVNAELAWLDFNERVLDQAEDDYHPLLERVKFLSIVSSNLDEFFMVRVASLVRKQRAGSERLSIDGMSIPALLAAIRQRAAGMLKDATGCWSQHLRPALAAEGVVFLDPPDYTERVRRYLTAYFQSEIYPLLTPLAFDPGHPFPFVSHRSKNLAVVARPGRRNRFARVKIPPSLPRFVPVPLSEAARARASFVFAFLEDVIRENLALLFPDVPIVSAHLFRVIRDAGIEALDDSGDDLRENIDRSLRQMRYAPPSLLHVEASTPPRVLTTLVENFEVDDDIVIRSGHRLDLADWMALYKLPMPHLKDHPFTPRAFWEPARDPCVFDHVREQDFLVHHPFESFSAVELFLQQAVTDPHVVGIKMTLYRVGAHSPIIDMLIAAAEAGKQVAVLIELKARFDERNNIEWAARLEDAGVHVVYGVENLKTHCKLCLVVRKEADRVHRYLHIATGNYNRTTAQTYTDFGLFTADPGVLADASAVFNALTGYSRRHDYHSLIVAPFGLRTRFSALVEREIEHAKAGRPARVIVKNNAITDPDILKLLYRASRAGVRLDLIVRGACGLRAGVPGLSENIHVRSIVGRFLEHSRAYHFENGGHPELYLGSADLMERNLDRRVEALVPVRDVGIARHMREVIFDAYLRDTDRAYVLTDRRYERVQPAPPAPRFNAQEYLLTWYANASADDAGTLAKAESEEIS
jgi:polyphosphate kinase